MEKRKVFKISIIDKEISRTEFDRNTFYTSDSELSLVFKLIEKDYTYDHGEILLYNENDESFVTREITKQENDFVYELDLDIIPHYGKWKAQLQLIKDGDVYTSKPFDFSIVNDLSNLAPQPTLTDINNWSTLKQSANELIDEMQDIIISVGQAESKRASKENLRQQSESERVNQENYRQRAESERISKENIRQKSETERVNNEKKRQIAELERDNKENTRQQAESQRQSTFELNETERQTTFETAETERQSAELIRIENEKQREIDHANRSAELAGKANKKQEDWITPTLSNGWEAQSVAQTPRYYKDEFGIVHLEGCVKSGLNGSDLFVLPTGYKTFFTQRYAASNSDTTVGRVDVRDGGAVAPHKGSSSYVYLSGISFRAEG